jgi:hypothetical protein
MQDDARETGTATDSGSNDGEAAGSESTGPAPDRSEGLVLQSDDDRFGIWGFNFDPDLPPEAHLLAKKIAFLDHRSLHTLGRTEERFEVRSLLYNTIVALQSRDTAGGEWLLGKAMEVYSQHVQAKNRIRYLLGMIATITFFLLAVPLFDWLGKSIDHSLLVDVGLTLAFAGMGAVTSVLTRLSSIDLSDQTSKWILYISGAARPITSMCFALVFFVALRFHLFDVQIGAGPHTPGQLAMLTGFLAGFSERFAQDILGRVAGQPLVAEVKARTD